MTETEVAWDLSDLFASPDDPKIDEALQAAKERAAAFAATYQGRIDSPDLTAERLASAIREYESLWQEAGKPGTYARLRFSADTSDPARGALMAKVQEETTRLSLPLVFYRLELARVADEIIMPLLDDPALAPYRYYIHMVRSGRPHQLSEIEETLLARFNNTGTGAFVRLSGEIRSATVFQPALPDGTTPEMNFSQLASLYSSPEREVRQAAAEAFAMGAKSNLKTLTFILNTLLQDKAVSDEIRHYETPESTGFRRDELPRETVELVTGTTAAHYGLAARYYALKREVLDLDTLKDYDLAAPLFQSVESVTFDEAQEIVLDAFGRFSPIMRDLAAEYFDKQWIDAAPRKGKQGGAYCNGGTPDKHGYIFLNYLGKMGHVMTLAHELGHGVHGSLSREQTYFNMFGTLPMAEVASTFGEMLVFDKLQSGASLETRLSMFADKIEGAIGTIMSTTGRYRLEKIIHRQRRTDGEMTSDQISDHWQNEMGLIYGDAVEITERLRLSWSFIPHFVNSPFYSYPYAFGELFALSLYQKSKDDGPAFADRYLTLLRAGGSASPHELAKTVGVDLDDPAFWQGGFRVVEGLIETFEGLWKEYKLS
ncbi:MAG: M3 family oligoendopeptidase [Janthinobacterium lividum]